MVLAIGVCAAVAAAAVVAMTAAEAVPPAGAPNCGLFPANSVFHADVRNAPVHANSATWVSRIGATTGLKADFGAGLWNGGPIGIPYTTVPGTQARVPITFTYADESDPGPYPIPPDAPIEGGAASSGDRHVFVVDRDRCELWETWSSYPQNGGTSWTAGSGAHFSLTSNAMRPAGWTSSDAAGLPILPFLVRYEEIQAGVIDHPLRFTIPKTAPAYVWPASHRAGTGTSSDAPMGTWFRLKADYPISGFSPTNQIILTALKEHGMVLADNGSAWYLSGVPDERWSNDDLAKLRNVPGSAFEALDVSAKRVAAGSYEYAGSTGTPTTTTTSVTTTTVAPSTTTTSTTVASTTTTVAATTTSSTTTTVPSGGGNGTFESGVAGWTTGNRTILDRTSPGHSGSWAGRVARSSGTGDVLIDDSPDWVGPAQARTYTASAWILAPSGRSARLTFVERRNGRVVQTRTASVAGTGQWQPVSVSLTAWAGSSLGVQVVGASWPTGPVLLVDDVTVTTT